MNDLISIIIPVRNGERYLAYALDSIKNQNMNIEIIVVDDCSFDSTSKIALDNNCIVIKNNTCLGPVISKNKGIKIAKGKYIMFLDHDDTLCDTALKTMYDKLINNNSICAVMAKVKDFITLEIEQNEKDKIIIKNEPYYGLFTGAVLIKKETFNLTGLFDETIKAGEIIDWQMRINKLNLKIEKLDLISTNRRLHLANFGRTNKKTEFKDYASLLRAKLRK